MIAKLLSFMIDLLWSHGHKIDRVSIDQVSMPAIRLDNKYVIVKWEVQK